MEEDKAPQPEITIQEIDEKYAKLLKEFRMSYQQDIQMLNKILSTYEDKLAILENQFYDISFKLKQLHAEVTKPE